jgi:hypothetical protein
MNYHIYFFVNNSPDLIGESLDALKHFPRLSEITIGEVEKASQVLLKLQHRDGSWNYRDYHSTIAAMWGLRPWSLSTSHTSSHHQQTGLPVETTCSLGCKTLKAEAEYFLARSETGQDRTCQETPNMTRISNLEVLIESTSLLRTFSENFVRDFIFLQIRFAIVFVMRHPIL